MITSDVRDSQNLKAMCEYINRMLMSARYYSIAHAYESIFENSFTNCLDFITGQFFYGQTRNK